MNPIKFCGCFYSKRFSSFRCWCGECWPTGWRNSIVTCRRFWVDKQVRFHQIEDAKLVFNSVFDVSSNEKIFMPFSVTFVSSWLKKKSASSLPQAPPTKWHHSRISVANGRSEQKGKSNSMLSHAIMECFIFSFQSNWCTRSTWQNVSAALHSITADVVARHRTTSHPNVIFYLLQHFDGSRILRQQQMSAIFGVFLWIFNNNNLFDQKVPKFDSRTKL